MQAQELIALANNYELQWLAFLWVGVGVLCVTVLKDRLGWVAASCLGWLSWTAMNVQTNPFSVYSKAVPYDLIALRAFSTDSLVKLGVVLSLLLYFSARWKSYAHRGALLSGVFLLASGLVVMLQKIMTGCHDENTCGGLVGNPSMNGCLMVAMLPIAFRALNMPGRVLALYLVALSVVFGKASIPAGLLVVLVLSCGAFAMSMRMLLISALVGALILVGGYMALGSELFNSGDRFEMWKFFWDRWTAPTVGLFGLGYGTFGVFSRNLQAFYHMKENGWWIWIHNDWLQTLFEAGWPGLGLLVGTYLQALWNLLRAGLRHEFISLVLVGLTAGCNYPGHLMPTALFAAWLMVLALSKPFDSGALAPDT